ncbi:MAG: 30S ribosomal protein S7 [Dehalococcoidia bacterium]
MSRRRRAERRPVAPDPKYQSERLARFINKVMLRGKKSTAQRVVYSAFDIIEASEKKSPLDVFEQALKNSTPLLEVKPRRVGGATYQVPIEVRSQRSQTLAMRWIVAATRARTGRPMAQRLADELKDAARGEGAAVKRRQDLHRMAEANRAFVHYRW